MILLVLEYEGWFGTEPLTHFYYFFLYQIFSKKLLLQKKVPGPGIRHSHSYVSLLYKVFGEY